MAPRPIPIGLLAGCLALVLAACAGANPTSERQAWSGTTTSADGTFPLTVVATFQPTGAWTGTYTVERTPPFTGDVDATLLEGVLDGELVVTASCRFELTGIVAGDALEATFAPVACPGGAAGSWSASRTTAPVPTGGTTEPADAAFDSGATFGDATFR